MANVIGPSSPKQQLMLTQEADLAIIGGAMGSGKSYISLLYPLKFADDPYFRGVIFRNTTGEITAQNGLWENACEIYTKIYGNRDELRKQGKPGGIKIHIKDLKITFPSGGSVKFAYLESRKDLQRHQGAAYTFCLFDEATHFSREMFEYLVKRMRSAKAKHKKQMVLTCNPDPDWDCLDWIRPYLLEDGTPDTTKDGVLRYYVVDNGEYVWSDDRETLEEKYGSGPDAGIRSFTFISANCLDNPPLLENDPTYVSNLKAQPFVDVQRYFYGNWYVRPSTVGYFRRDWCEEIIAYDPSEFTKVVRAWDFAATLKSDAVPSPDYTVSVLMAKTKTNDYIVLDVRRMRIRPGDWETQIVDAWEYDRQICGNVVTIIPQDPGASGQMATSILCRALAERGIVTEKMRASGKKLDRFRPFSASSQVGSVKFLKGCGNDYENKVVNDNGFVYRELEAFDGLRRSGEHGHDDIPDAISDAFSFLASKLTIPNFLGSIKQFQQSIGEQKVVSL